jgi:hypothetical protein
MYPWWEHDGERINVRATSRCGFRLQVAYWMEWSDISPSADRLYERNPGTTLASADGKRYDQSVSLLPPLFPKILKDVAMPSTFFHPFSSFFILFHQPRLESGGRHPIAKRENKSLLLPTLGYPGWTSCKLSAISINQELSEKNTLHKSVLGKARP